MKTSESLFVQVRGIRYHVRRWALPGAPKLFLFHGWMDVSASFQFLVDALLGDWDVYAPDWRGYGLTEWGKSDCYWFPDY
ncbi:MAG: alpha/beta hydrolase, partial [Betaproteobacteria bacterium]